MTPAFETVFVRKRKRPIGSGVWAAYVLAEDSDGIWLHTPAGSLHRGEDGEQVGYCESARDPNGAGRSMVQLVPATGWWIASWIAGDDEPAIAIDICTPPELSGSEWAYADLELDPFLRAGRVGVDDWDEFVHACEAGVISADEEAAARSATAQVEHWLRDRIEPFGGKGLGWLDTVRRLALPPLVVLDDVPIFP